MSFDALERIRQLTRAQFTVLAFLQSRRDPGTQIARASSREIALATELSRRTVQPAINRLNELQLIKTLCGCPTRPSEHTLLQIVTVQPPSGPGVPVGGGAMSTDAPVQNAYNCASAGGANSQGVPGAIVEKSPPFPQCTYKEPRASDTYTYTKKEGLVGVCKSEWKTSPTRETPSHENKPEILVMVERWFWPVDAGLAEKILELPERFGLSERDLIRFWEWKWKQKKRQRQEVFTPGAFFDYTVEDLPGWLGYSGRDLPERKPPASADYHAEPIFRQEIAQGAAMGLG